MGKNQAFQAGEVSDLVVDEADIFAPQMPETAESRRSLAAIQQLTRRFRYKGMGASLITQRPAELHKSPLGQVDLLLALRVISPQDINALDGWIKRNASAEQRAEFLATISSLPTGTAWAWSPQWLHLFEQVQIRQRTTFDSSATPKPGVKRRAPKHLAEINLTHLTSQMQALIAQTTNTDPVHLQEQIRALQEELKATRARRRPDQLSPASTSAAYQPPAPAAAPGETPDMATAEQEALAQALAENAHLKQDIELLSRIQVSWQGNLIPLTELPVQLHLGTLRTQVQQAVIEIRQIDGALLAPAPTASRTETVGEEEQAGVLPQEALGEPKLLYSEQKLLERLTRQVKVLSPSEKALFAWLIEHDETKVSSQQLADAVSMDVRYTWSRQTSKLVKIPFIGRWGAHQFWYQAFFGQYCRKYFASVPDRQFILQQLLAAAQ